MRRTRSSGKRDVAVRIGAILTKFGRAPTTAVTVIANGESTKTNDMRQMR